MEIKEYLTNCNYWAGNGSKGNKVNKYIVIHYVGAVSTALNNAKYFYNTYRGASANYFVDENDIYRVVKDSDTAWHCGTTGAYKHPKCRNTNSIGIEMCCFNNNGVIDVSDKVVERTIELVKELMAKYNIPVDNVVRHYDVTGKNCPAPMVSNPARWNDFKAKLGDITKPSTNTPDQVLRVGSVVKIDKILTVSKVDARNNLIAIPELTGTPTANYHWFDPTNFDVVDNNGNKTSRQVCYVGCKVKLNGEYKVLNLVKTEAWACQLQIGNRKNWVWTEPCYEIKD